MTQLVECTGCSRHVRAADSVCPFCDAAIAPPQPPAPPPVRMGRTALLAFGAALMSGSLTVAAPGCGSDDTISTSSSTGGSQGGGGEGASGGGGDGGAGGMSTSTGGMGGFEPLAGNGGTGGTGGDGGGFAPPYGHAPLSE